MQSLRGRRCSKVTKHFERRFVSAGSPFAGSKEIEQINAGGSLFDELRGGTPVFLCAEVFGTAPFRAFDAAINRDGGDRLLPEFDGQVTTLMEKFRDTDKIDPGLCYPCRIIAAQLTGGFGSGGRPSVVGGRPD